MKCDRTNVATREFSEPVASTSRSEPVSKATIEKHETESDAEKDPSRRPSKDESSSSSSDSPSGDEYNVYYYDSKAATSTTTVTEGKDVKSDVQGASNANVLLGNLKKTDDLWDVLFARAEGLYAHGHTREACILGIQLAEELLANPPNLMKDVPPMPPKGKRKRVNQ